MFQGERPVNPTRQMWRTVLIFGSGVDDTVAVELGYD